MRKLMSTGAAVLALAGATTGTALAATSASGGSVKVTLTSPRAYEGPARAANITCTQTRGVYVVRFARTARRGAAVVTGALTIADYSGPGSYTGRLTVGRTSPRGSAQATPKVVPVSITDTGGEAAFSRTLTGARHPRLTGKVVTGTVDWTCAA
jgi:hypothetical protein